MRRRSGEAAAADAPTEVEAEAEAAAVPAAEVPAEPAKPEIKAVVPKVQAKRRLTQVSPTMKT